MVFLEAVKELEERLKLARIEYKKARVEGNVSLQTAWEYHIQNLVIDLYKARAWLCVIT